MKWSGWNNVLCSPSEELDEELKSLMGSTVCILRGRQDMCLKACNFPSLSSWTLRWLCTRMQALSAKHGRMVIKIRQSALKSKCVIFTHSGTAVSSINWAQQLQCDCRDDENERMCHLVFYVTRHITDCVKARDSFHCALNRVANCVFVSNYCASFKRWQTLQEPMTPMFLMNAACENVWKVLFCSVDLQFDYWNGIRWSWEINMHLAFAATDLRG